MDATVTPFDTAPQQAPRPLPLFLEMLRNQTEDAPDRRVRALAGLRAYQAAPRPPRAPAGEIVATAGRATLRSYAATGRPVVFVPSLINPPYILDLSPDASLLRWLATQGFAPLLVDWGQPRPADRAQDIDSHIEQLLLPLLRSIGEPPLLVGYCLGGTIALAAAALTPVAGVALIAAPWRFAGFGNAARADIAGLWSDAQPACDQLGLVPIEVLQSGFWRLDPARTIGKFEAFADIAPDSDAARRFVALEDWANDGAPIAYAAGRQMFDDLFDADLPGTRRWRIGDTLVDPHKLASPLVEFVSANDRIVPAASAIGLPDARILAAGHVGMIVGSSARAQLWQPLADWLTAIPSAR
ncbi:alpha/beta fold hydrolase [Sphingomonas qomolangmaensis]|uniref:Alpha/beta fold hydrolase n=1 Tax=Sphingomonas qomolangmaensis TaxID=2918765 RepID=A0ABY5LDD0_9SPHN|nr:alpha/beta fold hydrolase [Sphingomonas qomolangmaensis]UUL83882.1 alpha/beta fold hydrolase [Sphingomonas qomolangmaensis]